jgi:hypothetical protein
MKNSHHLLCIIIVFFSVHSHAAILKPLLIEKKALAIGAKISRDRRIMYGVAALSIAHEFYQWAPLLKSFFVKDIATQELISQEKKSMAAAFKAGLRYYFYTENGWSSLIHSGISLGGFMLVSVFCEKLCKEYVHSDTLHWYIKAHVPYRATIEMMQGLLVELQDMPIQDDELAAQYIQRLQMLYERLITHSIALCGYMKYKSQLFDDKAQATAQQALDFMIAAQNRGLQKISEQLASASGDYKGLMKAITSLEDDNLFYIKHFALLEKEFLQDRSSLKQSIYKLAGQR